MIRKWIASLRLPILMISLLLVVLLAATPAFAQEGEPAPQSSMPAGVGILILLIGLAAIGIVGASVAFPRMSGAGGAGGDEDDELIQDDELQ